MKRAIDAAFATVGSSFLREFKKRLTGKLKSEADKGPGEKYFRMHSISPIIWGVDGK